MPASLRAFSRPELLGDTFLDWYDVFAFVQTGRHAHDLFRITQNGRSSLAFRNMCIVPSSLDIFLGLFNRAHLHSLTTLCVRAPKDTKAVIEQICSDGICQQLATLREFRVDCPWEDGYPTICDSWIKLLCQKFPASHSALLCLSLPRISLTSNAFRILAETRFKRSISRPMKLELHAAKIMVRGWSAFFEVCLRNANRPVHLYMSSCDIDDALKQLASQLAANISATGMPVRLMSRPQPQQEPRLRP